MSATTRTTERIESTVERVEVEEVQCPICEQWYEHSEQLTVVGLGVDYDSTEGVVEADHLTRVCTSCAESLFDVDVRGNGGRLAMIRGALLDPITDVSVPPGAIRAIAFVAGGLAVTGVMLNAVLTTLSQEVDASEFEQAAAPAFTVLDLLSMLALVVVAWAVLSAPRILGRRR